MSTAFGQTTNIGTPGTGWRKLDIMERIIDQDPRATPFFEISGMSEARTTKHEWQVRGVPDRVTNETLEGAALAGQEVDIPSRVFNTCQILTTGVEVTRTSQRESHYGVGSIWQDQIDHFSYVHRGDTEFDLINNVEAVESTTTAVRAMDGLVAALSTNATDQGGIAFSETMFIDAIKTSWDNQDAPVLDCLTNASLKRGIDTFASVGAVRNMEVRTRDVVHLVTKYFSSFGEVDIHLTRDLNDNGSQLTGVDADNDIVFFDRRQMSKAYLDRTHLQPVAKTADADTLVIISELTLNYGNELGGVVYTDVNVTL
jgi:hypothetical protein